MDPQIKKRWIEALKSGNYTQGRGSLRVDNGDKSNFCCLGVLCDIAAGERVVDLIPRDDSHDADPREYVGPAHGPKLSGVLPDSVVEWADLRDYGGERLRGEVGAFRLDRLSDGLVARLDAEIRNYCDSGLSDIVTSNSTDLVSLNDLGVSFDTIADVIEELG